MLPGAACDSPVSAFSPFGVEALPKRHRALSFCLLKKQKQEQILHF